MNILKSEYEKPSLRSRTKTSICGKVVTLEYFIVYEVVFMGFFKFERKFYETTCGYGDCYNQTVYEDSPKEILDVYNHFLLNEVYKTSTNVIENINDLCNKLNLNKDD